MSQPTTHAKPETPVTGWRRHLEPARERMPGVLICITIALATTFIADHYGGPTLLYALLFGMTLHFLSEQGPCLVGVEFAARTILRLGVALLGVRITLEQVAELGIGPVVTVVAGVVLTILAGSVLARLLGLKNDLGLLTGGSVAICGASAALALSAAMPRNEIAERNTILTVVGVTTLSTAAMVLYPLLVGALGLTDTQAGIFLGGTIHDVAQVVGAGYMISDETGDISTFVKLLRVAMLVPAVMVFMLLFRRARGGEGGKVPMFPSFLVAFVVLVLINSLGVIPQVMVEGMTDLSRWCLVTAIAALGIKTSFQKLAVVGWKPVILMVAETVFLLGLVLVCLYTGIAEW
ncbi:putative sulfate exporter family transporter [Halomonas litopenaei]|uniref:Sulfate exporter family transporter n=1 Tax=Halomonas litopenaei TaxID=2109328 RepID=A0ABX5J7A1_9GAMM|nr:MULTISPECIES: putative sulfate exporter family transporter [Halomonas]PTL93736.1 putative sulfate exporter family transporter [Halomonas sp. SYSU XM8]PTL96593.1 putative sulfate exporter family transporter [Halomonas litopenaei]USZ51035.1 putative sulfate exporter family transporter [Halomonas sp. DN3]